MAVIAPSVPADHAIGKTGSQAGRLRAALPWLGVVGVAAVAVWLGIVGVRALTGAHDLRAAVRSDAGIDVGPALLAAVIAVAALERFRPAVLRPAFARAHLVDAAYLVLFGLCVVPVLSLVQAGFATEFSQHAGFLMLGRLPLVPQLAVVVVILVGMDLMNWLAHVANHRWSSLWRLHALHHSQEELSVLSTFRTHPLIHATYQVAMVPALVLSTSGAVPAAALVAYGIGVTFPHANLRWTFGPLGRIFVSPTYHRLHHSSEIADPRQTVNFGFVLVFWDQLARRAAYATPGAPPVATGLAGRPVPVEQGERRPLPAVILAQLAQPVRSAAGVEVR